MTTTATPPVLTQGVWRVRLDDAGVVRVAQISPARVDSLTADPGLLGDAARAVKGMAK